MISGGIKLIMQNFGFLTISDEVKVNYCLIIAYEIVCHQGVITQGIPSLFLSVKLLS